MKAVLLSISSGWCWQIAAGKKTVEIRKNRPHVDTPFRCYIYCTRATPLLTWQKRWSPDRKTTCMELCPVHGYGRKRTESLFELFNGKIIGTFICDKIDRLTHVGVMGSDAPSKLYIETPDLQYECADELLRAACLSESNVEGYLKGGDGFGWHISELKIYDKPREVQSLTGLRETKFGMEPVKITRPPQSWSYVEEQTDE